MMHPINILFHDLTVLVFIKKLKIYSLLFMNAIFCSSLLLLRNHAFECVLAQGKRHNLYVSISLQIQVCLTIATVLW